MRRIQLVEHDMVHGEVVTIQYDREDTNPLYDMFVDPDKLMIFASQDLEHVDHTIEWCLRNGYQQHSNHRISVLCLRGMYIFGFDFLAMLKLSSILDKTFVIANLYGDFIIPPQVNLVNMKTEDWHLLQCINHRHPFEMFEDINLKLNELFVR